MRTARTSQPKIGRPRLIDSAGSLQPGAPRLFDGEWLKILRGLKRVKGGQAFLALPEMEKQTAFRRLCVIASLPTTNRAIQHLLNDSAFSDAADQVQAVRLRWLIELQGAHPAVTDFALRHLRRRVEKLKNSSPDYWQTVLIGSPPSDAKLSAAARKAVHKLRKHAKLDSATETVPAHNVVRIPSEISKSARRGTNEHLVS